MWLQPQPLAQTLTKTSVMMGAHADDHGRTSKFVDMWAGGTVSACPFHADKCIREFFGTPWSRNSI
jgi:hypothetical protein